MASAFENEEFYLPAKPNYSLLPFRFTRLDSDRYVAVNEVGESQVLLRDELQLLVKKRLPQTNPLYFCPKGFPFSWRQRL